MTDAPPTPPSPAGEPDARDASATSPAPAPQPAAVAPPSAPAAAPSQANLYLWITVGALALLFAASIVLRPPSGTQPISANDADIAATRAELEARRADVNRQLAELNLPTMMPRGEALEAITARMRKDADTLISLVERSQQLVAEKDRLLTEKNVELIRSEQLREALSIELARNQNTGADAARMADEVAAAAARANRLADELAAARQQIAELSTTQPDHQMESMQRRLEEATRARDFFELRAAELEMRLRQQSAPEFEDLPDEGDDEELPEGP